MTVSHASFELDFPSRVAFVDVTDDVATRAGELVAGDGMLVVYSQHTTCAVVIQEQADDVDLWGEQLLMQDLTNGLRRLFPTCDGAGQYLHPGPEHISIARAERDEEPWWSYNTDAHLRSALLGRSVTVPIEDGRLVLGEFGRIYFGDFDQVRARRRTVRLSTLT